VFANWSIPLRLTSPAAGLMEELRRREDLAMEGSSRRRAEDLAAGGRKGGN